MATLSPEAEKEIDVLVDKKLKGFIPAIDPATATKEDFAKINEMIVKSNQEITKSKDDINKLSEQLDAAQAALKAGVDKKSDEYVSLEVAIKDAFKAKAKEIADIVKAGGRQTEPLVLEVGTKAAVDLTVANTIGAGTTQYSITQNTGKISKIRQREEKYLSMVSVGSITSPRALWIEEQDEQGTPIFIAEGTTKTQISVKYVEKTAEVRKIPVYGKVTTEMMADTPQLISYIQNNMVKRVSLATESALIDGDGLGDNLKGFNAYATAFNAGVLAGTIQFANEFDVIRAIALQVELGKGIANALYMHPTDWAKAQLIKDENGRPLWKEYLIPGTEKVVINGMEILTTLALDAGEFAGGDMTVVNVLYRDGLTVQIGLSGDDFINNKKTILVEQRLVQFVSANDTQVLVKGDFTTAKAALNAA